MGTVKSYETKTRGKLYEVWYAKPDGLAVTTAASAARPMPSTTSTLSKCRSCEVLTSIQPMRE